MKQFILKTPEGLGLGSMSEAQLEAVSAFKGISPSDKVVGSSVVDGFEIQIVMANIDGATLQSVIDNGIPSTDENGDPILIDLELEWEILAEEGVEIDPDPILIFMDDINTYDEDGEITDTNPATIESLQTYSGRNWTFA